MDIDAVIIEVEFHLHSMYEPYGHFVCLRFIDTIPQKTKLTSLLKDFSKYPDVKVVDYNFNIEKKIISYYKENGKVIDLV